MDKILTINLLILDWYGHHQRHLPWRESKNPYFIWLSEIILQQTRVEQGMQYYLNFTTHYPTIESLANASEQEILKLWQGLGYYTRARNLHHTAQTVYRDYKGLFPDNFLELKKLKGIGDYTAAAIASICFNEAIPALDGNMYRVFARYFGIYDDIALPKTKKVFFELGISIIDKNHPGDFNQAVMDLGATICKPKNPLCTDCPLNDSCYALQKKEQDRLPVKSKKIKVKDRFFHFYLLSNADHFLLTHRTQTDVWQHLYTLPLVEQAEEPLSPFGLADFEKTYLYEEKHILSHQKLWIRFYTIDLDEKTYEQIRKTNNFISISKKQLDQYPLPKPIEKFMKLKYFN
ncbi:A/G-specific adenine glycosylase [Vaginella massiliensis]|uniref:A/G-specific adenine glycosylase n=1 Tax=Vaginella massiliensis TaxID=1816680 RepID=UPI000838CD86|nr:A/G-specific adenine glycosylase [Vaginella massiliensis]